MTWSMRSKRCEAVSQIRARQRFEPMFMAFKRMKNILRQATEKRRDCEPSFNPARRSQTQEENKLAESSEVANLRRPTCRSDRAKNIWRLFESWQKSENHRRIFRRRNGDGGRWEICAPSGWDCLHYLLEKFQHHRGFVRAGGRSRSRAYQFRRSAQQHKRAGVFGADSS